MVFKRKYHLSFHSFSFSPPIWEVQNISLLLCNNYHNFVVGLFRALIWDERVKVVSLSWGQRRSIPVPPVRWRHESGLSRDWFPLCFQLWRARDSMLSFSLPGNLNIRCHICCKSAKLCHEKCKMYFHMKQTQRTSL